jgi:hypothetical protein
MKGKVVVELKRYTIEGMEDILNTMQENGHIYGWGYMFGQDTPEHPEVIVALFDDVGCYGDSFVFQRDWLRTELTKMETSEMYQVLLWAHRIPELIRVMEFRFRKDLEWDDTHAFGEAP